MKIDGSCHCGDISFEAEIDPDQVIVCHCTDCQTLSGSAYRTVVPALQSSFKLLTGVPKTYIKTAEDGTPRAQVFCPECGTPIYAGPVGDGTSKIGIRVGVTNQRDQLIPRNQYWCRSAQSWVQDLSSVAKVES
jgi:hypothetical protein